MRLLSPYGCSDCGHACWFSPGPLTNSRYVGFRAVYLLRIDGSGRIRASLSNARCSETIQNHRLSRRTAVVRIVLHRTDYQYGCGTPARSRMGLFLIVLGAHSTSYSQEKAAPKIRSETPSDDSSGCEVGFRIVVESATTKVLTSASSWN